MEMSDALIALWRTRGADPRWFKLKYEEAVERIEDHSSDPENPYWEGPTNEESAIPGGPIVDITGTEIDPDMAERMAFEMLVLADLARASNGEGQDGS